MAQVSKYTNSYSKKCHYKILKNLYQNSLYLKKMVHVNNLEHIDQFKLFFSKSTLKLQLLIKYNLQIQFLTYKPNI